MDYANYWASATATADLGDTIDQSIRLRLNNSVLSSTLAATPSSSTITVSFWFKSIGTRDTNIFRYFYGCGNHAILNQGYLLTVYNTTGAASSIRGTRDAFTDPSAWYHFVGQYSSGSYKLWVNGVQWSTTTIGFSPSTAFRIGGWNLSGGDNDGNRGLYLADFHFLDGTAKDETDFGKYNDDGVWVPIAPSFTAAEYGAGGFHLTFDSSQTNAGIGEDSAPIGASGHTARNDFTSTDIDTADVASYAGTIFTDHVNTGASATPNTSSTASTFTNAFTNAFDGSTSTRIYTSGAGSWIIFRPSTAIPMSTGLRIWAEGAYVNQVWLNGSNSSFTSTGTTTWQTIPIGSETQITNIAIQGTVSPAAGATLFAIEVDGTILVHNIDNDVDYFDTPTSNFPTFNPGASSVASAAKANLQSQNTGTGNWHGHPTSVAVSSGKWYWEVYINAAGTLSHVGVDDASKFYINGTHPGQSSNGYGYQSNATKHNNDANAGSYGATFTSDDVIGVALDLDGGEIEFYKNGSSQGVAFTGIPSGSYVPAVAQYGTGSSDINLGQMPFIYTAPTGYGKIETNNLPEPTIKNGKKHFDTVTYTGASSAKTVTGLEFQPDLIWFKSTSHSTSHALFDSVRGASAGYLMSDATGADETSNGTLTSFNSDGFTTGVPAGNEFNNGGGRTYVAWCWKAGGTAVSNTDGTITSSVSANTDAGFSIVSYTGNSSGGATVGHGLNNTPDVVVVKGRDSADEWHVKHSGFGNNSHSVRFNSNAQMADFNAWNNTAPTNTVFTIGPVDGTNESGEDFIAYCWHSVEGFSKFGDFTGNGDADGPFVYLGFRPAFVMIKRITAADSWHIFDTAQNPTNNGALEYLQPDTTNQSQNQFNNIDILSNGFKLRSSNSATNGSGTYVYFCFAENPFGGENIPPATAR